MESSNEKTRFEIIWDKPTITAIGDGYSIIELEDCGPRGKKFGPQLYGKMFNIAVPRESDISLTVEYIDWTDWEPIIPAPRGWNPYSEPIQSYIDSAEYSQITGGNISIVSDQIWRGVRVIGVDVIPIQYNPRFGVRFINHTTISVTHSNGILPIYDERLYHPVIGNLYRASLINPDVAIPEKTYAVDEWDPADGAELLVITTSYYVDNFQPWYEWKLFMGMPTIIALTDTIGSSIDAIKDFITDAYYNWTIPPIFLLIVGDSEDIPTFYDYSTGIGDNNYCTVDGDDIIPDIFPGRMSVDNNSQLELVVLKHLNYEKEPDTTDDWYARAIGVVREEDCPFDGGPDDSSYLAAVSYAMEVCSLAGYSSARMFTKCSGDNSSTVRPYLAAGCNFVTFRGQGVSDWWSPFGGLLHTASGKKLPIFVSITCSMGSFHMDGSPCEEVTRSGTISNPTGGVAWYGQARTSSNSQERSSLSKHIFEGFFPAGLTELAAAHTYGKNEMLSEFGGGYAARIEYLTTTLVGSPEMRAWTAPITDAEVICPEPLSLGYNLLHIQVSRDGDEPASNARVAVHQADNFSYGITDSEGIVEVGITIDVVEEENVILVVTGSNIYPYVDTIDVILSGIGISSAPVEFVDIVGDGDGLLNPGETIAFIPRITNLGDSTSPELSGVVRINDPQITLLDSETVFPSVAPDDTVSGDSIKFMVSSNHIADSSIPILMEISGEDVGPWYRYIEPSPAIHRFEITDYNIELLDNPPYGNGNGLIEPREHIFLKLTLENETEADGFSLFGKTTSTYPAIFYCDSVGFGNLTRLSSSQSLPNFLFVVMPEIPPSTEFTLDIHIFGECPMYEFWDTLHIHLSTSEFPCDIVTGPDSFGYYIIDETDISSGLAPTFQWNDISEIGELITEITDSDDNQANIALPFTLNFYDQSYDSITVSSNGFVAPPGISDVSPEPYEIPDSLESPAGIISPLWADLAPHRTGCDIYSYYDSSSNQFIIQYDNIEFYYTENRVTFQIVICDTDSIAYNEIYFYYNLCDTPMTNYSVGIESPHQDDGLQYYFYPDGYTSGGGLPIESGRALRITTITPGDHSPPWLFYYGSLQYDDVSGNGDGIPDAGEEIKMTFQIKNAGGEPAYETVALPVATEYIEPIAIESEFGDIIPGSVTDNLSNPIYFRIMDSCPDDTSLVVPISFSTSAPFEITDTIALYIYIGSSGIFDSDLKIENNFTVNTFPNPFNSSTTIDLFIDRTDDKNSREVNIALFNIQGRKIATLYNGTLGPGKHRFRLDGENLQSGLYLIKIDVSERSYVHKVLLIR